MSGDDLDYFAAGGPEPQVAETAGIGLPMSEASEKVILGSILIDNDHLTEASDQLTPDDFALDSHQKIFLVMQFMASQERAIDIVTLAHALDVHKWVQAIGGVSYLSGLTEGMPMRPVIDEHIRIVKEASLTRRLMQIGGAAVERATARSGTAAEMLDQIQADVEAIAAEAVSSPLETFASYVEEAFPSIDTMFQVSARQQGVPSGIRDLDAITCGWQKGNLIIIGARPSMGKTALAVTVALNAALGSGKVVALFSLEMSKKEIFSRALAIHGSLRLEDIREGRWTPSTKQYAKEATDQIIESSFFINDEPHQAVARMKAKAQRLKKQMGGQLDLVIVDQLNHIQIPHGVEKQNRADQIGAVTRALKGMAKSLDVPLICLHQLNRGNEKRDDMEPRLSDLRGSGDVEQDADDVVFIHRPGYYSKKPEERNDGKALLIVAKQRQGRTDRATVEFIAEQGRFCDQRTTMDLFNERVEDDRYAAPF